MLDENACTTPPLLRDGRPFLDLDALSIEDLEIERRHLMTLSTDPNMDDLDETTLRYFLEIGARLRTKTIGPAKPKTSRRGGAIEVDLF